MSRSKKDLQSFEGAWRGIDGATRDVHKAVVPYLGGVPSTNRQSVEDKFSERVDKARKQLVSLGSDMNTTINDWTEVCNSHGNSEAVKLGFINATLERALVKETFKVSFVDAFREVGKAFTQKGTNVEVIKSFFEVNAIARKIGEAVHEQVVKLVNDTYALQEKNRDLQQM